jgi:hypothetical protein
MALQTCQIMDHQTLGSYYLETYLGEIINNNILNYPIDLCIEIIDVVDGIPKQYHSSQIVTLSSAPTGSIREAILPLIQALPELSNVEK